MADVVQWHSRRVPTCVRWSYFMLSTGEETESAGKIERFGRNRISAEIPPLEEGGGTGGGGGKSPFSLLSEPISSPPPPYFLSQIVPPP